jgi:hypothetical protein
MKSFAALILASPELGYCHMPGADLTSWDALLREDYAPIIQNELTEENPIQAFMAEEVADDSWSGREKWIPIKIGRNWSVGSIGAGGALPAKGRGSYQKFQVPMRDVYGAVGFERYVMEQSRNKKGSWAFVVPQEMNGLVEDLAFSRNRIGWYYGAGILALLSGAHNATTTLTLKNPGNVTGTTLPNRYLFGDATSGMTVAITDSTGATIKGTGTLTAVSANGNTATIDTAITGIDGDLVVLAQTASQSSFNKEPEGLLAGIDDGTYVGTYHGLSRTTYPILQSPVFSGIGSLSADAIQQAIDAVAIKVGKTVDMFLAELGVLRAYLVLTELDRRYSGADLMRPDAGSARAKKPLGRKAQITFGDIPFFGDRDGPFGSLFGVNKGSWVRYVLQKGKWADEDGHTIRWVQGFDQWQAFWYLLENYHCHQPARNFRMDGITTNQVVIHSF